MSFGTKTINEMQETIDDYIDNRQEHLDDQQQYDLAELEFMNKYGTLNAD